MRITHDELYSLEPALIGKEFDSIFFTKSDKSGDIHSFCNNLVAKLLNENKIKIINKEVINLSEELNEYDRIFLCRSRFKKISKKV